MIESLPLNDPILIFLNDKIKIPFECVRTRLKLEKVKFILIVVSTKRSLVKPSGRISLKEGLLCLN